MTQVLIDSSLWELNREAFVDVGGLQPALLTTTTAPIPNPVKIGVFETILESDVVVNSTQNTFVYGVVQDWTVTVSEAVTVFISGVADVPQGMFEATTVTDVPSVEGIPNPSVSETSATTESVTVSGLPNPGLNDTTALTESTTAEILGP